MVEDMGCLSPYMVLGNPHFISALFWVFRVKVYVLYIR